LSYIGNKPANKAVVASGLDPAVITGQTALAVAPADTDEFLISDAGTLKRLDASLIGGGKVLQAVTSSYTGSEESTSSNTFQASSLFVNITPSATTSKVLVMCSGTGGTSGSATGNNITLYRDSTNLGDSTRGITSLYSGAGTITAPFNINLLDSPSTTSQVTYKIYFKAHSGSHAQYISRDGGDSFITALEIGA
jgi:hypothetical protein